MTTIYCFSGSGHSLAVSRSLSQILECEIIMINNVNHTSNSDTAVIVFIPPAVPTGEPPINIKIKHTITD